MFTMFKKAFTIIELVIAMLIFWSWLLVVLTVINQNIISTKKVVLKTTATFLAKDAIEQVYNFRDSNVLKWLPWNYLTWTITKTIDWISYDKIQTNKMYIPIFWLTWFRVSLKEITNIKNTRLYKKDKEVNDSVGNLLFSWWTYSYFTWKKTPFYSYVIFSGVYLQWEWWIVSTDKIMKLTSKVFYQQGSLTGSVSLESFISWRK